MSSMADPFGRFGIAGYGHFGQFLARSLAEHGDVLAFDVDSTKLAGEAPNIAPASLAEVAKCDVVVVAVPAAALEGVLLQLRGVVHESTVVMDVVSTKAYATGLLRTVLAGHPNLLATHPLFGPPSMDRLEAGQRLVVTFEAGPRAAAFTRFLAESFGINVISVDADEHDRAMAYMQALPFFIARALDEMGIDQLNPELEIPSFHKLAEIARIERHHSPDMFETSQLSNPYAREVRQAFLEVLTKLEDVIDASQVLLDVSHPELDGGGGSA
jgi:prephenate dehydrogenase